MTANPTPVLPEQLHPLATELGVYYRELPRLLQEGEAGRYAVVKGETFHGTWDTFRDARQYGYDRFEDGLFLTQKVDARYLSLMAPYFGSNSSASGEIQ
jgi:hypothetical protein